LQDNTSNKSHISIIIYCYPRLTAMIFLEFQKHDSITTYNRLNFDGTIKEKMDSSATMWNSMETWLTIRAFQFGQKSFDSILATESIFRFNSAIW